MELSFASKGLRQICERQSKAQSMLGAEAAASLQRRLSDIEAADALTDLEWLAIAYGDDGTAAIEFHAGHQLHVEAVPKAPKSRKARKTDWTEIDRIKLIGIDKP